MQLNWNFSVWIKNIMVLFLLLPFTFILFQHCYIILTLPSEIMPESIRTIWLLKGFPEPINLFKQWLYKYAYMKKKLNGTIKNNYHPLACRYYFEILYYAFCIFIYCINNWETQINWTGKWIKWKEKTINLISRHINITKDLSGVDFPYYSILFHIIFHIISTEIAS